MIDRSTEELLRQIEEADAVVVGGAAGMSASGGFDPYRPDETFEKYLGDFSRKYGIRDWFNGHYANWRTLGERWAYIARSCQMIYETQPGPGYAALEELLDGKDFFVVTTNQDQLFRRVFGDDKVAWIQGDWGWFQCGTPCCDELHEARPIVERMLAAVEDCAIPADLVPRCPRCGAVMEPWVRGYTFLEGELYREQYRKYNSFLKAHLDKRVLFLELGVGSMTPMFIKEPFWNYVYQWPGGAFYLPITKNDCYVPREIVDRSMAIDGDIASVLGRAVELKRRRTKED